MKLLRNTFILTFNEKAKIIIGNLIKHFSSNTQLNKDNKKLILIRLKVSITAARFIR